MRLLQVYPLTLLLLIFLWACQGSPETVDTANNVVTAAETDAISSGEWVSLFDGQHTDAWRNFKGEGLNWKVEDGLFTTEGNQGDIITKDTYENFELEFEWKIERGGNSGVMFNVLEGDEYDYTFETGPEYQLIDNDNYEEVHNYKLEPSQVTAANYALHTPKDHNLNPAGEFNTSRILVNEGHVEHWINGEKVVEYDLWSSDWEQAVAQTKFRDMPAYGKASSGHIALQDHGDIVWFKSIRIREL
jgi:hypothetical protein